MGPLIDLDAHLSDGDPAGWEPYLRDTGTSARLRIERGADEVPRLLVADRPFPKPTGPGCGNPRGTGAVTRALTPREHEGFCAAHDIVLAFVQPGFVGLAALTERDVATRRDLIEAHNRRLLDYCSGSDVLEAALVVSPHDARWSMDLLDALDPSGHGQAVVSRPTTFSARPWSEPEAAPLLGHLVETGRVLFLHGGTGYHQVSPIADLFEDYRLTRRYSHSVELHLALLDLAWGGWLARGLRVVILEGGTAWIPWFVSVLQEMGQADLSERPLLETVVEQVLFVAEPMDDFAPAARTLLGDGCFAFGSDYPHWDAIDLGELEQMPTRWSGPALDAYRYGNAARLLHTVRPSED